MSSRIPSLHIPNPLVETYQVHDLRGKDQPCNAISSRSKSKMWHGCINHASRMRIKEDRGPTFNEFSFCSFLGLVFLDELRVLGKFRKSYTLRATHVPQSSDPLCCHSTSEHIGDDVIHRCGFESPFLLLRYSIRRSNVSDLCLC